MTRNKILAFLGDFEDIRIAAKKAARIGQAFSSSISFDSSNLPYEIKEDDKSVKGFLFTDGIGQISREAFDEVRQWL
jgi:RNA-dependent RNA polymerase